MIYTCRDCGKKVSGEGRRCCGCAQRARWVGYKYPSPVCPDCGTTVSGDGRRCSSCATTARWARGDFDTDEYRSKLSEALKAAWARGEFGEDWVQKVSAGVKAAHARGAYGEDWRQKVSAALKIAWERGDWDNEECIQKRSEASSAAWRDPVYRQRITAAVKARCQDPAVRCQMREWAKARWQDPNYRAGHSGQNCHLWRDGTSTERYPQDFTEVLRLVVRGREGFACMLCSKPQDDDRSLDVHHIDGDKQNSAIENLVALCVGCHSKVHSGDFDSYRIGFQAYTADLGGQRAEV